MSRCNITAEQLRRFYEAVNGSKINTLHISFNEEMGEDGFGHIGAITNQSKVEGLSMQECNITAEQLRRFYETVNGSKITRLNISWNKEMGEDGFTHIGAITNQSKVEDLNMSLCNITAEQLRKFHETLSGSKIRNLNLSGNHTCSMGNDGIRILAQLVRQGQIDRLYVRSCHLTKQHESIIREAAAASGTVVGL